MTSRRNRALVGLAAALTVGLTSCSADNTPHPGAAAVVNGAEISTEQLDGLVDAQCAYLASAKVAGQPTQPMTVTQMRYQLLDFLVTSEIVKQDVQERDLKIRSADVDEVVQPLDLPPTMSQQNKAAIEGMFHTSARRNVGIWLISSHLVDPQVTSSAQMTRDQTNQAYVAKLLRGADVQVNPKFGRWNGTTVRPASGSLSVAGSYTAKKAERQGDEAAMGVQGMPSSQYCG